MHEIKYIKVNELNLLENNPRMITKERFEILKDNIAKYPKFFKARPCLVNDASGKLVIYGGNQRYRAAIAIGLTEVPCDIQTLTMEEQRAGTILDNVSHGKNDWDILANDWEIEDLKEWGVEQLDFDIALNEAKLKEPKICKHCGKEL